MNTLRIALEPQLIHASGPQVHWTWREILTTLGYAWNEVALGDACDIAFVADATCAPRARLCVRADHAAWATPSSHRLAKLSQVGVWPILVFKGDSANAQTGAMPTRLSDSRWWLPRDIAFDLFWLATGQEERHWPQGAHGFYDLTGSPALRDDVFQKAPVMQMLSALQHLLCELGVPAPEPRWPNGKRAAVAISHDVDYPEVIRWLEPARIVARQGARGLGPALGVLSGKRTHWHFANWQALEREYGARSAFYFVARQGSLVEYATGTPDTFYDVASPRFTNVMRELVGQGWEVGLHASYRANEDRARFAAEKRKIEAACGQPIAGNRHHYWHMNPSDVEETLLMHEQVGFEYDSSLTHDRYLGWRRGLSTPFYPFHQKERRELRTLQLPVAWMDAQVFVHTSPSDDERRALLNTLIDRAAEDGGTFVINIHDYVFDDALFPGWSRALREALDHIRERGDFWHATPVELARHWSARYQAIRAHSQGLQLAA
jgi:hypothetical protein